MTSSHFRPSYMYQLVLLGVAFFALLNMSFILILLYQTYDERNREERRKKAEERWRPLLTKCRKGEDISIPEVQESEYPYLLPLWTTAFEKAEVEKEKRNLIDIAEETGLDSFVRREFSHLRNSSEHQAVLAVGYLRMNDLRENLIEVAKDGNSLLSVVATHSLVELDPSSTFDVLGDLLHTRTDWPRVHIKYIVGGVDKYIATRRIPEIVRTAPEERKPDLIPMLGWIDPEVGRRELRAILQESQNQEVVAAVLRTLRDLAEPGDRKWIQPFLEKDAPFIRAQAAALLGRIGTQEDEDLLVDKTSDPDYWVRFRAAEALSQLPHMSVERMRNIKSERTDPYARDMMEQFIQDMISR